MPKTKYALVVLEKTGEEGFLGKFNGEGGRLYGKINEQDAGPEYLWVYDSGDVKVPPDGICLRDGWRVSTENDEKFVDPMDRVLNYTPNNQ